MTTSLTKCPHTFFTSELLYNRPRTKEQLGFTVRVAARCLQKNIKYTTRHTRNKQALSIFLLSEPLHSQLRLMWWVGPPRYGFTKTSSLFEIGLILLTLRLLFVFQAHGGTRQPCLHHLYQRRKWFAAHTHAGTQTYIHLFVLSQVHGGTRLTYGVGGLAFIIISAVQPAHHLDARLEAFLQDFIHNK